MNFWQVIALILAGFALGMFTGAKYIAKPITQYNISKMKAKGEGNKVEGRIEPGTAEPVKTDNKKSKKLRIFKRKRDEKA